MSDALVTLSEPVVPLEVREFAAAAGADHYLGAVIELARRAFPSSSLAVSLGQHAEDETHPHIALDVPAAHPPADELLPAHRVCSAGLARPSPPHPSLHFLLGRL